MADSKRSCCNLLKQHRKIHITPTCTGKITDNRSDIFSLPASTWCLVQGLTCNCNCTSSTVTPERVSFLPNDAGCPCHNLMQHCIARASNLDPGLHFPQLPDFQRSCFTGIIIAFHNQTYSDHRNTYLRQCHAMVPAQARLSCSTIPPVYAATRAVLRTAECITVATGHCSHAWTVHVLALAAPAMALQGRTEQITEQPGIWYR